MATELGKAYVQIIPSAEGISGSISSLIEPEAKKAGESAGFNITGAIKTAIKVAGIGTMIKSSLEAGGNLQQSFGGIDTIYGTAADSVKNYAAEAAKAGISANTYAEQAVSFGASLKQAFGDDIAGAAEAANTAIMDMADNSAKMGTDIVSIQNAYQGFAKQNYTMLDNLKLGYGGTKTEMERLLADAQELSGVEYDIENLGDVYSAIHVIQEELGLTDVATAEAAETFSGSLGSMKAAAENLMANLTLGEDIGPSLDTLQTTIQNFVFKNLFPMLANIIKQVPNLLTGLSSIFIGSLNMVKNNADEIVEIAVEFVTTLASSIVEMAPYVIEAVLAIAKNIVSALWNMDWISVANKLMENLSYAIWQAGGEILGVDADEIVQTLIDGIVSSIQNMFVTGQQIIQMLSSAISSYLPQIITTGQTIISSVLDGILTAMPRIIRGAGQLVTTFASFLMQNASTFLKAGIDILLTVVKGILQSLPEIVTSVIEIIDTLIKTIAENLPLIVEQGFILLTSLIKGILDNLPLLINAIISLVYSIIQTIVSNLPLILQQGANMIRNIVSGIVSMVPTVLQSIISLIQQVVQRFTSFDWGSIGRNLIQGIANGISSAAGRIADAARNAAQSAFQAAKEFLGINSPATKGIWLGDMYDEGVALGVKDNVSKVQNAATSMVDDSFGTLQAPTPSYDFMQPVQTAGDTTVNMTINAPEGMDIVALADLVAERINFTVKQKENAYA